MNERVLDIVVFMVSRLRGAVGEVSHYDELAVDLKTRGFTEREINLACSWMFDRYGSELNKSSKTKRAWESSVRVLSEPERVALSSAAVGYLFQLVKLGILRATDFEEIVEACVQSGRHAMSIEEMKFIISGALFSEQGAALNFPGTNAVGDDSSYAN